MPSKRSNRDGMTLAEVMVATAVVVTVAVSVYSVLTSALYLNYASTQRIAAFHVCRDDLERMRGAEYDSVTVSNFPSTSLTLTHLGGSDRIPLVATRASTIAPLLSPERKLVTVTAQWTYRGRPFTETVTGVIYRKE